MQSTRVVRVAGAAGVLAAVLILGGLVLASLGFPGSDADAQAWVAWAQREELAIEIGVYGLLVPGLFLFLCMFVVFAQLLPADAPSTRLANAFAPTFCILLAVGGVLTSTSASAFGFFDAFDDPAGVTVFMGISAGYHLQDVGIWSLAMTMLATAVGLRNSSRIPSSLFVASVVLAAATVAATFIGVGIIFGLAWVLAVSVGLLRTSPVTSRSGDPGFEGMSG